MQPSLKWFEIQIVCTCIRVFTGKEKAFFLMWGKSFLNYVPGWRAFGSSLYYCCNFPLKLKIFQYLENFSQEKGLPRLFPGALHTTWDLPRHLCVLLLPKLFPPRVCFFLKSAPDAGLQKNGQLLLLPVLLNPELISKPTPFPFLPPALNQHSLNSLCSHKRFEVRLFGQGDRPRHPRQEMAPAWETADGFVSSVVLLLSYTHYPELYPSLILP